MEHLVGLIAHRAGRERDERGRLARRHRAQVRCRLVGEVSIHCHINWNDENKFRIYILNKFRIYYLLRLFPWGAPIYDVHRILGFFFIPSPPIICQQNLNGLSANLLHLLTPAPPFSADVIDGSPWS